MIFIIDGRAFKLLDVNINVKSRVIYNEKNIWKENFSFLFQKEIPLKASLVRSGSSRRCFGGASPLDPFNRL